MYTKKAITLFSIILWVLSPGLSALGRNTIYSDTINLRPLSIDSVVDSIAVKLDEVVVQAFNRRQDLVQVPGAISSVGAVLLDRENPVINILPVMQYTPGVFAQQGATNTSRVIIRGTGARVPYATGKIRGYFNNIPLTNTSGITFIEDIDPGVIQSLDIIKGPAPSVYGAGLGGTIVLNALDPQARRTGFSNATQLGAFGLLRNVSTLDWVREDFASTLVFSHAQREGYRENNQYIRNALSWISQFGLGQNTRITSLFTLSDLKSYIPSSIDSITYADNPTAAAANWRRTRGYEDGARLLGGINVSHDFSTNLTTHLSVFSVWHDEKEMRPFDVFYQQRYTLGTRLRMVYKQFLNVQGLELSAGGEAFRENYTHSNHENINGEGTQGDPFSDNKESVNSYNIFLQTDGSFGRLNLSGGVNVNYINRDYDDLFNPAASNLSGTYDYGLIFSPRLAANYLYLGQNALYLSLSHGFAPPSLDETLTPEGFVNPDILPEKSWNLELGLRGKLSEGRFYYDFSLYGMRVHDLLVAQRVGEDAWVGRNAGRSLHRGIESEMHWVLQKATVSTGEFFNELSLRANMTLNDFRFTDFSDRGNDYSGNKIPGVPDQIFFAGVYARSFQQIYVMPSWRYVGSFAMNDANSRFTESYSTIDVLAGFQPRIGRVNLDIYVRANNLLDKKYASMILVNAPSFGGNQPRYYYPGLPFHLEFGLKIKV